jgi:hypothetical protein
MYTYEYVRIIGETDKFLGMRIHTSIHIHMYLYK